MVVSPGTGWPGDTASRSTPVADRASEVLRLAQTAPTLRHLDGRISVCRACPRLVAWREQVADEKRAAYAAEPYWGRPVPAFGDDRARIAVVGLAPAAHGANRTGRMFTGDRSGEFLYAALWRAGLANRPESVAAGDGLELRHTRIMSAVRCAPPANKPSNAERDACRPWLVKDLQLMAPHLRAVLVLGQFAWSAVWPALELAGYAAPDRIPAFSHGVEAVCGDGAGPVVVASYHVSQQNTFTGKLTPAMLDDVVLRCLDAADLPAPAA
ncbi:MAG TPA: uracil-DNA glycosylase [Frankiaceae bacterium]|jgi:uracil-DNA glycosylase family 4